MSSSTAWSARPGSARHAASWSGCWSQGEDAQARACWRWCRFRRRQEAADPGEFVLGQIAVGQVAEQVVGGVVALGPHQFADVLGNGAPRLHPLIGRGVQVRHRQHVRLELLAVGIGHAEHFADHQCGNGLRVCRHQVQRRPVPLHRVQRLGGDLLDALGQLTHPPHGELAGQQPPVAGVMRRVDAAEVPGRSRRHFREAGDRDGRCISSYRALNR